MRENGFRAIGGLAQKLTSGMAKGRSTSLVRLKADWPAVVGPELARTTRPDALLAGRGARAGKALRLKVSGAVFAGARLGRADLRAVLGRGALFREADLTGARLDGADLMGACFESACLRGASLRGASLYRAETWLADLEGADLTGALLAATKLAD